MRTRLLCYVALVLLLVVLPKTAQAQTPLTLGNDNYLATGVVHNGYTTWNAVRDHVISGAGQGGRGYYGQSPCEPVAGCGCAHTNFRGAWGNYIGRDSRYRSSFNNNEWKLTTDGIQVGMDFFQTRRGQFGAIFGYENTTGSNLGDRIAANDHYIGFYGVHVLRDGADLRTIFGFGWQDFTSQRNGIDASYRTAFKGNTAECNIDFGKRYYSGTCCGVWSVRPAVALDWSLTQLGGGRESSPGLYALQYHKTDFTKLFFRFGSDLRYERGRWAVESGLFYSYDLRGSDLWAFVSDMQQPILANDVLVSSQLGRSMLAFNVSSSIAVWNNLTLFGGYRGEAMLDQAGRGYESIGYVGGAWRW